MACRAAAKLALQHFLLPQHRAQRQPCRLQDENLASKRDTAGIPEPGLESRSAEGRTRPEPRGCHAGDDFCLMPLTNITRSAVRKKLDFSLYYSMPGSQGSSFNAFTKGKHPAMQPG